MTTEEKEMQEKHPETHEEGGDDEVCLLELDDYATGMAPCVFHVQFLPLQHTQCFLWC